MGSAEEAEVVSFDWQLFTALKLTFQSRKLKTATLFTISTAVLFEDAEKE